MKTHPILFSTEMVQAILAGRKTQTRRVSKHQYWSHSEIIDVNRNGIFQKVDRNVSCPYGKPGDLLWVRETFHKHASGNYIYKSTEEPYKVYNWKPSIHMPKDACRIWLRTTAIRIERLKNITEEDAIAEGIIVETPFGFRYNNFCLYQSASEAFKGLWQSINGEQSWKENPWVWVVEFEVLSTTGFNAIAEDIRKEVMREA